MMNVTDKSKDKRDILLTEDKVYCNLVSFYQCKMISFKLKQSLLIQKKFWLIMMKIIKMVPI